MRKSLLTVCIVCCALSALHADEVSALRAGPYLQNPTPDSVTVMWHSEGPSYGWVEYGKTDQLGQKADLVIDGLRHANTTLHKVPLVNLETGTTYYYRVAFKPITRFSAYKTDFADTVYSETYTLKTIPSDAPRTTCVIFNDLHNNEALFTRLCDVLGDADYQFSIFNGDCFSDPSSKDSFLETLDVYNKGISAHSRPALYIRGNHEARGAFARSLKTMFDLPDNEYFFAMTAGPIRFIFLDWGEDKPDEHWAYSGLNDFAGYRQKQQEWLKEEVKSEGFRKAKYRVLVHHIPLRSSRNTGDSRSSQSLWLSVLNDAPIDLAINAHVHQHSFRRARAAGNRYPVLIGGGNKLESGTVMVLSATDEKLSVKMLDTKGEALHTCEIGGNGNGVK
jgi:hypothetical protein